MLLTCEYGDELVEDFDPQLFDESLEHLMLVQGPARYFKDVHLSTFLALAAHLTTAFPCAALVAVAEAECETPIGLPAVQQPNPLIDVVYDGRVVDAHRRLASGYVRALVEVDDYACSGVWAIIEPGMEAQPLRDLLAHRAPHLMDLTLDVCGKTGLEDEFSYEECGNVALEDESDYGIFGLVVRGISCVEVEAIFLEWHRGGGPLGFDCETVAGPDPQGQESFRCTRGDAVVLFDF